MHLPGETPLRSRKQGRFQVVKCRSLAFHLRCTKRATRERDQSWNRDVTNHLVLRNPIRIQFPSRRKLLPKRSFSRIVPWDRNFPFPTQLSFLLVCRSVNNAFPRFRPPSMLRSCILFVSRFPFPLSSYVSSLRVPFRSLVFSRPFPTYSSLLRSCRCVTIRSCIVAAIRWCRLNVRRTRGLLST